MTVDRNEALALEYAKSVLGNLPKDWRYARVGDLEKEGIIEDVQDGNHGEKHPKASDYVSSGIPFVMAKDIINNRLDLKGCNFIAREHADTLRIGFAKPCDVLLTHKATMGRVAIVPNDYEYVMLTPQVTYYRIKNKLLLEARYLKYAFLSPRFQHQLNASSDQSTRKFIGITAQRDLWFPLPPFNSQIRIAEVLGTIDEKIELNRRMNETLEAMARRLFKSWFVDFDPVHAKASVRREHPKMSNAELSRRALPNLSPEIAELFPDEFEDSTLGPIPKGWKVGRVSKLCVAVGNGATPKRDTPEYWVPATIPWLTSGEVRQAIVIETENFISDEGQQRSAAKLWPAWTTIVALYGATAGQSTISSIPLTANQACCGLQPIAEYRLFQFLFVSSSTDRLAQQARGSAQQNLSKQIVEELALPIPDKEIASHFEASSSPLFDLWVANLRESKRLAATRDKLLPRLLSGDLSVSKEVVC